MLSIKSLMTFPLQQLNTLRGLAEVARQPNAVRSVQQAAERQYVTLMMDVIGRGLAMASHVDADIQRELRGFAPGYVLSMKVHPRGPQFFVEVQPDHTLKYLADYAQKPNLTIIFKHMHHAFLLLSFQESTARAFANDRMVADGDVSSAIRLVRCLNRLQALILPRLIAERGIKSYPQQLSVTQKLQGASRIYLRIASSYLSRSH